MKTIYYFLFIFLMLPLFSSAQSPKNLSYQGVLTDTEGDALPDGTYTLTFALYDDATGGTILWEENINTETTKGLFNVILGQTEALDLAFDRPYWMGISVDGGDELFPRTALTASPYSLGGKATELDLAMGEEISIRNMGDEVTYSVDKEGNSTQKGLADFNSGIMIEGGDTAIYLVPVEGGIYFGPDSLAQGFREKGNTRKGIVDEINAGEATLSVKQLNAVNSKNFPIYATSDKASAILADSEESHGVWGISKKSSAIYGQSFGNSPAIHGINKNNFGVLGESDISFGVVGKSKDFIGIRGEGASLGVEGIGKGNFGVGIKGRGPFAAGVFEGNVFIKGDGKLSIDNVDLDNSEDRFLVWGTLGIVEYRTLDDIIEDIKDDAATDEIQTLSLAGNTLSISKGNSVVLPDGEGGTPFNGCLDNLDFKITTNTDPFFTVSQTGYADLKGSLTIQDQGLGSGLDVKSSSTAIIAKGQDNGVAISATAEGEGDGVFASSQSGNGVFGYSFNGDGVVGQTVSGSSETTGVSGIGNAGVGVYGIGDAAAGLFDGNVLIEEMGQLKIDRVDNDNSDNLLVWAGDKFVKTRSLSEALSDIVVGSDPFNGCLDNLDFKVTTNSDPFFTVSQTGYADLKGSLTIQDQGLGSGLDVKSSSTAIIAKGQDNGVAISAMAEGEGDGVFASSQSGNGVFGYSFNGDGVVGQTVSGSSETTGVSGIGNAGVGVYGIGDAAAGLFDGNVLIEEMGQLKIDRVDTDASDNILVWADDKFVKYRTLGDILPDDADMIPTNELQTLNKDGNVITLDRNGGSFTLMDDDPTNELFNGVLCDKDLVVKFGEDSVFVIDSESRVGIEGAFGAHATTSLPAITGAAENNVSVFGYNSSSTLPTASFTNTIPGGPVFSAQGNSFFGNGTNTYITFTPGQDTAAQFFGAVDVQGTFTALAKSFVIDHPLDPENKQLKHFSIESDQLTNIYNGNAIMDENGEAWVELPEWFEALNKDFSYQLTCVGGFANVYIAEEVNNNRFKIGGGKEDLKVSWQVSGLRHDRQSLEIDQTVEILKQ